MGEFHKDKTTGRLGMVSGKSARRGRSWFNGRSPTGRAVHLTGILVMLVTGAIVAGACTGTNPDRKGTKAPGAATTTAETRSQLLSDVTMVPLDGATGESPTSTVAVHATGARLERVEVQAPAVRSHLTGYLNAAGDEWLSTGTLRSGTAYQVTYTVEGTDGLTATGTGKFTTAVPGAEFAGQGPTGYVGPGHEQPLLQLGTVKPGWQSPRPSSLGLDAVRPGRHRLGGSFVQWTWNSEPGWRWGEHRLVGRWRRARLWRQGCRKCAFQPHSPLEPWRWVARQPVVGRPSPIQPSPI